MSQNSWVTEFRFSLVCPWRFIRLAAQRLQKYFITFRKQTLLCANSICLIKITICKNIWIRNVNNFIQRGGLHTFQPGNVSLHWVMWTRGSYTFCFVSTEAVCECDWCEAAHLQQKIIQWGSFHKHISEKHQLITVSQSAAASEWRRKCLFVLMFTATLQRYSLPFELWPPLMHEWKYNNTTTLSCIQNLR